MIRSGQTRVKAPRKERAIFKEIKKREDLKKSSLFLLDQSVWIWPIDSITIFIGVHFLPLHLLSETLHAATPKVISRNAFSTILSPAFEIGSSTEILPSALIFVCMNKFMGVMIGRFFFFSEFILSRQFG